MSMRSASFVVLLLVPAACSEPDTRIDPAQVNWMEWPAEVLAATSFTVRVAGYGGDCRPEAKLVINPTVDQSAVTFEPYFLVPRDPNPCRYLDVAATAPAATPGPRIIAPVFDTRAAVPGLEAQLPRTYEIRAGTDVYVRSALDSRLPIRTFGEVTVRSSEVATERLNAGGFAYAARDSLGCVTLYAYPVYPGYVIENPPADTAQYWSGFVRGYLYKPAAPVCGASQVFHLVTRN
jgi:hypothetical protein